MSSQELPYTKTYDIYDFLEKEFLNADKETLRLIINYYYAHFGGGAGNYLINTYNSWKSGYTKISSLTFGRIIECMPKFLSDEKRFIILKTEIDKFLDAQKRVYEQTMFLGLHDINKIFSDIQSKILEFSKTDLQWFIGKNIFTEELIQHYLKICRFVLNEKIVQSYRSVSNDLNQIKVKLSNFSGDIDTAYYQMNFVKQEGFNGKKSKGIDVMNIKDYDLNFPPLKEFNFELDKAIKKFGESYFLEELMRLSFDEKNDELNSIQKGNDIDIFFAQFIESKHQADNEISMKGNFKGAGGILEMKLQFIPHKILIRVISACVIKLVLLICTPVLLILIILRYWEIWVVIISIYIFIFTIGRIPEEFNNLKTAIKRLKNYGRK